MSKHTDRKEYFLGIKEVFCLLTSSYLLLCGLFLTSTPQQPLGTSLYCSEKRKPHGISYCVNNLPKCPYF